MLTQEQLNTVKQIHQRVLSIFEYKTDEEQFGELEYWQDVTMLKEQLANNKLVGDCDDFALACRHLLWEHQIPNRLVLCLTEQDEGHLVCEAQGYILDNRQTEVKPAMDLPYEWIKMSGYNIGDPWTAIAST